METYKIPLSWRMYGYLKVTAPSLQDAIDYALGSESSLPEGNYEDDSLLVDQEALAEMYDEKFEL